MEKLVFKYDGRPLQRPVTLDRVKRVSQEAAERAAIYREGHSGEDGNFESIYYREEFIRRTLGATFHKSVNSIPEFNRPIEKLRQQVRKDAALSPVNTNTGQKAASPKKVASPKGPASMEKENPAAVVD